MHGATATGGGFHEVARREWRLLAGSTGLQVMHLFGPATVLLLLWLVFSQGVLRDLPIVVVDSDKSALSRQLIELLDAAPGIRVDTTLDRLADAEQRVRRLEAYGVVFIPEDFQHDIRRRLGVTVTGFYNAQFSSVGSTVNRDIGAAVRTLGSQFEAGQAMAGGVPRRLVGAALQPIASQGAPLFNPQQSYEVFLFTAFVPTVLQLFFLLGTIWAVGSELRNRTAGEWLRSGGNSIVAALAGKLVVYFVIYTLVLLAATFGVHAWMGWGVRESGLILVLGQLLYVAACQGLAVLLVSVLASLRGALSFASLLAGPAFGFAGVSLPVYTMNGFAATLHRLIPLSSYLRLYAGQAYRGADWAAAWGDLIGLGLFIAVGFGAGLPLLRRISLTPEKWGAE